MRARDTSAAQMSTCDNSYDLRCRHSLLTDVSNKPSVLLKEAALTPHDWLSATQKPTKGKRLLHHNDWATKNRRVKYATHMTIQRCSEGLD